jgi:hypothetical protein
MAAVIMIVNVRIVSAESIGTFMVHLHTYHHQTTKIYYFTQLQGPALLSVQHDHGLGVTDER